MPHLVVDVPFPRSSLFRAVYEQHAKHDDELVVVLGEVPEAERDAEVGMLYNVRFPDGEESAAWPEELVAFTAKRDGSTYGPRIAAMASQQGTACVETALCGLHDSPENRAELERESAARFPASDRGVKWLDDCENELLTCNVCGVRTDGTSSNDDVEAEE